MLCGSLIGCEQTIDPFEEIAPATCYLTNLTSGTYGVTYTYNSANQVIGYSDTTGDKYTFSYDLNGLLITAIKTYSNGNNTFKYKYDANKRLIELVWGSNDGNKLIYTYNSNGQVTKMQYQYKNSSGNYVSDFYQTFAYVSSNTKNYSEINYYNAAGQLTGKESYQYDSQPNPFLSVNAYRIDWDLSEPVSSNNPTKIIYTSGSTAQTTTFSYTYNSKGYRLTQLVSVGASTSEVKYTYSNCSN